MLTRLLPVMTPTPLQEMHTLRKHLGVKSRLFVKRDDLTPFGGGKYRKAAVLVDRAIREGASVILSEGSIESRHARSLAVAARLQGLRCVLVLSPECDTESTAPTLLDESEGAEIVLAGDEIERSALCEATYSRLIASRLQVVRVPFSGSTPETAVAYAYAFDEFLDQFTQASGETCTLFVSSATGGIQAGLEVGRARRGATATQIIGVSPGIPVDQAKGQILELASAAGDILGFRCCLNYDDVCVLGEYAGSNYLRTTPEAREAIALANRLEGLNLDPTYTAKTFAALLDFLRNKKLGNERPVVFWHTAG